MLKEKLQLVGRDNDEGLSLLEIVIAVAIIAIFAVVGIIGFQKLTDNARNVAVDSAAQQVYIAEKAYRNGVGDYVGESVVDDYNMSSSGITASLSEGETDFCITAVYDSKPEHTAHRGDCNTVADTGDNNNGDEYVLTMDTPQNLLCQSPILIGNSKITWEPVVDSEGYVVVMTHDETQTYTEYIVESSDETTIVMSLQNIESMFGNANGLGGRYTITVQAYKDGYNISERSNEVAIWTGFNGSLLPSCD